MTLRIQCPACSRQFKVGEDLRGRTVECGACEKQFRVDDGSIITEREKFYPDDVHKDGLERYARAGASRSPSVQFATATYSDSATAGDVLPAPPQRVVANALGVIVLVLLILVLVFGSQENGILKDMELTKRAALAGFVVAIGAALIIYGGFRRKVRALLTATALGAGAMVLALFLPVPNTMSPVAAISGPPVPRPPDEGLPPPKQTEREVEDTIGYAPIQKAFDSGGGKEAVVVVWAPVMEERFKYQLQRYLQRKTALSERPSFYKRGNGGLFIIEGSKLSLPEVEAIVDRFGVVEEVYPNIRIIKVTIEGDRLMAASPELMNKLTDTEHPAFYVRNQNELDHIDLDRVEDAAQRLADVEPKRFRPEIARRLLELLEEGGDEDYLEVLMNAIKVWTVPEDNAVQAVEQVADRLLRKAENVPRTMVEFLVERDSRQALLIVKTLWLSDTTTWESVLEGLGARAESTVADRLNDPDRGVRQSAARLLRRIGTPASLPALNKALQEIEAGDEDMRSPLEAAIEAISGGS